MKIKNIINFVFMSFILLFFTNSTFAQTNSASGFELTFNTTTISNKFPSLSQIISNSQKPSIISENISLRDVTYKSNINLLNYPNQVHFEIIDSSTNSLLCNSSLISNSCNFNYNINFIESTQMLSWNICNNLNYCVTSSNLFLFHFTNGGEDIFSGIHIIATTDFNGTVIPEITTPTINTNGDTVNNNLSYGQVAKLPSLSQLSLLSTSILIFIYFLF